MLPIARQNKFCLHVRVHLHFLGNNKNYAFVRNTSFLIRIRSVGFTACRGNIFQGSVVLPVSYMINSCLSMTY